MYNWYTTNLQKHEVSGNVVKLHVHVFYFVAKNVIIVENDAFKSFTSALYT